MEFPFQEKLQKLIANYFYKYCGKIKPIENWGNTKTKKKKTQKKKKQLICNTFVVKSAEIDTEYMLKLSSNLTILVNWTN